MKGFWLESIYDVMLMECVSPTLFMTISLSLKTIEAITGAYLTT